MNILQKLHALSHSEENGVFLSDIFFGKKKFWDNNIFFTALIAYTLKSIKHSFTTKEDLNTIDQILENCIQAYPFFKNRHGGLSYNFYQTQPVNPYPGISFMNKFKAIRVPDDSDDSSMVYLTNNAAYETCMQIKANMAKLSYDGKTLNATFKKYRNTKAYRTWFATKMKHDMDICVVANVLLFVFDKRLPLNEVDDHSIDFICQVIKDCVHLTHPYIISPHYKKSAIILYHIARLISTSNHPKFTKLKAVVLKDTQEEIDKANHPLDKVILYTSLLKLGITPSFQIRITEKDLATFFWFKANPFSTAHVGFKKIFSKGNFLHLKYRCIPYSLTLLLELKQLSKANLSYSNNIILLKKE